MQSKSHRNHSKNNTLGMTVEDWERVFETWNEPAYRAVQAFQALHKQGIDTWADATTLSKELREQLDKEYPVLTLRQVGELKSSDGTVKLLFEPEAGNVIETVVIPAPYGAALCISTQIGCPVGCTFCKTGRLGFARNLTASEIVGQFRLAEKRIGAPLDSVILMGMGEPMLNFDNTVQALSVLTDKRGRAFSARRITISTVGYPKKIRELAEMRLKYNLALSLHFTNDDERRKFIPTAAKQPLSAIFEALDLYAAATGAEVTLEYVMMDGVNCSNRDARALAYLARWGWRAEIASQDYLVDFFNSNAYGNAPFHRDSFKINLIPYNPTDTAGIPGAPKLRLTPPSNERAENFAILLTKYGARATIRKSRGTDISAACGMLGSVRATAVK
jgi:23S rRNA (adenine2503-C2)-methyltransferase